MMSVKQETRGRKPLPPEKRKQPQATVKINDFILPFVKELKSNLKNKKVTAESLSQLFSVLQGKHTNSESKDPQPEIKPTTVLIDERLTTLVLERDKERLKVVKLEGKLRLMDSNYRGLKHDYNELKDREYNCMAIKTNGDRCTRPSVCIKSWNGIAIRACRQHAKKIEEKFG